MREELRRILIQVEEGLNARQAEACGQRRAGTFKAGSRDPSIHALYLENANVEAARKKVK